MKLIVNGKRRIKGHPALQNASVKKTIKFLTSLPYGQAFNTSRLSLTVGYASPAVIDKVGEVLKVSGMFDTYAHKDGYRVLWANPKTIRDIKNGTIEL